MDYNRFQDGSLCEENIWNSFDTFTHIMYLTNPREKSGTN